jgi:hypothetical protein
LKDLIKNYQDKVYLLSIILLIGSVYLINKYTNNIHYLIAELSLLLFTPIFWLKAFKYITIQILHTLFSETFTQTIFSMFDKHIQKPIKQYKDKTLSWYKALSKPKKIMLWVFISLFGFILIILLFRSPVLIKLFWKKIAKFLAGRSAKFILTPYIEAIVLALSGFVIYRIARIYLVKKIIQPIKRQKYFQKRI